MVNWLGWFLSGLKLVDTEGQTLMKEDQANFRKMVKRSRTRSQMSRIISEDDRAAIFNVFIRCDVVPYLPKPCMNKSMSSYTHNFIQVSVQLWIPLKICLS